MSAIGSVDFLVGVVLVGLSLTYVESSAMLLLGLIIGAGGGLLV